MNRKNVNLLTVSMYSVVQTLLGLLALRDDQMFWIELDHLYVEMFEHPYP